VATGAAIATGNLFFLAVIVRKLLPEEGHDTAGPSARGAGAGDRGGAGWAVLAVLKLGGLLGLMGLLMYLRIVSPLALLAGFGALPLGIAIGSLVSDRSAPPPKS
jgi:hypothetical protein